MKVIEKYIFVIFLISSVLLYGFQLGWFPVRIYAGVILFFYLLHIGVFFKAFRNKELLLYLAFVFSFYISLIVNNDIVYFDFGKYFFSRYFICFIAASATFSLIKSQRDLNLILLILLIIGICNSIINYLQFFGLGGDLYLLLKNGSTPEDFINEQNLGLNVGTFGLFGNIVTNGYFSAVFIMVTLHFWQKSKNKLISFILLFILFLSLFSLFTTQQRFVFLLVLLILIISLLNKIKLKSILFSLPILMIIIILITPKIFDLDLGRLTMMSDQLRVALYTNNIDFILNNIWFGGIQEYSYFIKRKIGIFLAPHNVFLLAFVYSGFIGGVLIVMIFIRMIRNGLSMVLKNIKYNNTSLTLVYFWSLFVFLFNSLTHNLSLTTGSEFIWILYFGLIKAYQIEQKEFSNPNVPVKSKVFN